jgi:hypothetical protein
VADSQMQNVEKLLDLPVTMATEKCMLAKKNVKVIITTTEIGSHHPKIGSSAVESYVKKLKLAASTDNDEMTATILVNVKMI